MGSSDHVLEVRRGCLRVGVLMGIERLQGVDVAVVKTPSGLG